MDSKKVHKRKKEPSKITTGEVIKKILYVFLENLIPFEKIENPQFRSFLESFSGITSLNSNIPVNCSSSNGMPGNGCLPNYETLIDYSNVMYQDYQEYFKNYFSKNNILKISLTCHNWKPATEINSYMFLHAHYINKKYDYCELPLGLFEFDHHTLSTFLVRDTMLKDLKDKLFFITTNYEFDSKILDLFKFISNEEQIENKIMFCFPTKISSIVKKFLVDIQLDINGGKDNETTSNHSSSSKSEDALCSDNFNDIKLEIPSAVQLFLGPIYDKFRSIPFDVIEPLKSDLNHEYYGVLTDYMLKNERGFCLLYLTSVFFYREPISDIVKKIPSINITEEDWKLLKFVVEFIKRFYDVVLSCSDVLNPTIHMALKWIKVLIIHVSTFNKSVKTYGDLFPNIMRLMGDLLQRLHAYHNEIDKKFDLIIASYLHPSTKRYLKENQISKINSYIASKSDIEKDSDVNNIANCAASSLDNLDDLIMELFDCSGKATKECYEYESSATNEVKYSKHAKYITKESGSHILQFWHKNQKRYPILSELSRQTLSVQLTSDRNFEPFKTLFPELQRSTQYLKNSPGDIQVLYFLHKIVNNFDVSRFDPKNFDLDIDDYKIEHEESDLEEDVDLEYYEMIDTGDVDEKHDISIHKRQKK